ncbi:MAG: EamA family transporter RarD [Actinomycetota bacterium]|nr:EamA family transporter RarD [Actinomycetota bacterium]
MPAPPETPAMRGIRAAVTAYIVWGLLTVYWKQLTDFEPFELIGWRVTSAAVVMLGVVAWRGRLGTLRDAFVDPSTRWRLALAGLLLTVNWTTYVWAVVNDRVLETALGYFMAPLGTMLLGITVLKERPTVVQRLAIACAVVAVVILIASYGRPPWVALAIAVSWSTYGLVKRNLELSSIEGFAGETLVMLVPALVVVAVTWSGDASVVNSADVGDWALIAGTGIVTAVPLLLFGVAARLVPFTILGALQYIVPTINFLLGWLAYDESLPAVRLLGFAFVWIALGAITVEQIDNRRAAPRLPVLTDV